MARYLFFADNSTSSHFGLSDAAVAIIVVAVVLVVVVVSSVVAVWMFRKRRKQNASSSSDVLNMRNVEYTRFDWTCCAPHFLRVCALWFCCAVSGCFVRAQMKNVTKTIKTISLAAIVIPYLVMNLVKTDPNNKIYTKLCDGPQETATAALCSLQKICPVQNTFNFPEILTSEKRQQIPNCTNMHEGLISCNLQEKIFGKVLNHRRETALRPHISQQCDAVTASDGKKRIKTPKVQKTDWSCMN